MVNNTVKISGGGRPLYSWLLNTFLLFFIVVFLAACGEEEEEEETSSSPDAGIYLSVIAFNENLTQKKFTRLDHNSKGDFDTFIDNRTSGGETSLYWAVDNAIMSIKNIASPNDIDNISIVTFTDGLDTSSLHASGYMHESNSDYLSALSDKIEETKVNNKNLLAYAIGVKGDNFYNDNNNTIFLKNLEGLSSDENNSKLVDDTKEIEKAFITIAESLTNISSSTSLSLSVSIPDPGTRIRFTFNTNEPNENNDSKYINATYNRGGASEKTHTLTVTGTSNLSTSRDTITGEGTTASKKYTFEDIKMDDNSDIDIDSIKQWSCINNDNNCTGWQRNSEFDPSSDSNVNVKKSSAAIVLVLDTSGSLGKKDFEAVQGSAKSFVKTLFEHYNDTRPWYNKSITLLTSNEFYKDSITAGEIKWYRHPIINTNITNDEYHIELNSEENIKVSAYDSSGKVLFANVDSNVRSEDINSSKQIYIKVSGNGSYKLGVIKEN